MNNEASGVLALYGGRPKTVGLSRSVLDIQPQFHPALLRLSAMISRYLNIGDDLVIVRSRLRPSGGRIFW
jgi:hypothetical protein